VVVLPGSDTRARLLAIEHMFVIVVNVRPLLMAEFFVGGLLYRQG
jgi:hypothetical protein